MSAHPPLLGVPCRRRCGPGSRREPRSSDAALAPQARVARPSRSRSSHTASPRTSTSSISRSASSSPSPRRTRTRQERRVWPSSPIQPVGSCRREACGRPGGVPCDCVGTGADVSRVMLPTRTFGEDPARGTIRGCVGSRRDHDSAGELRRRASGPDTGVIQRTCTACSGDVAQTYPRWGSSH